MKKIASEVLREEASALLAGIENLDENELNKIVEIIYQSKNRLVILGVGKSGLIGKKIAATLSSTGTPSIFIHATEAMHGDFGAICKGDIALVISYSGESSETACIMPHLKQICSHIITMTKDKNSTISSFGDFFISIKVPKEACPLNAAPTSSSTLTLALGDALAVCLMKRRNFSKEDFAKHHPGGSLGKRLFVRLKDLMQTKNLPIISQNTTLKDAIIAMTNGRLGNVIISESNKILGILSDGDLRRAMMQDDFSLTKKALDYATLHPKICDDENILAFEALNMIEQNKIQLLVITDKSGSIRGVIHLHKLIEAGIK